VGFLYQVFQAIPTVATHPVAIVAYVIVIGAWLAAYFRTKRFNLLIDQVGQLPENDRKSAIRVELNRIVPATISAEQWLKAKRQQYYLVAFLVTVASATIILIISILQVGSLFKSSIGMGVTTVRLKPPGAQAQDIRGRDAFEEMALKTVRLHITGTPDGAFSVDESGTGFFIDGGHIVTAAHVFGEADWRLSLDGRPNLPTIDIDQPNPYGLLVSIPNRNSGARLVGQNRALDLALIQINGNSPTVMCAEADLRHPDNRPYSALGWQPNRSSFDTLSQPANADVRRAPPEDGDQRWRFSSMTASEGNSGGPIFDNTGGVIAVITSGRNKRLDPGQPETFGTPIQSIRNAFPGYNFDNCFKADRATTFDIQDAIDHANIGEVINIPAGTFKVNLKVNKALTLKGQGPDKTILQPLDNRAIVYVAGNGLTNAAIEDLSLAGSNRQLSYQEWTVSQEYGLQVRGATVTVSRVNIYEHSNSGINAEGAAAINLQETKLWGNFDGIVAIGSSHLEIAKSEISNNRGSGVKVGGVADFSISGRSIVKSNGVRGLVAEGNATGKISESSFDANGDFAILMMADSKLEINSAQVTRNGGGIFMQNHANLKISESDISKNALDGLVLIENVQAEVRNNTFEDNGGYGIAYGERGRYAPASFPGKIFPTADKLNAYNMFRNNVLGDILLP
jgi:hypothetical protein